MENQSMFVHSPTNRGGSEPELGYHDRYPRSTGSDSFRSPATSLGTSNVGTPRRTDVQGLQDRVDLDLAPLSSCVFTPNKPHVQDKTTGLPGFSNRFPTKGLLGPDKSQLVTWRMLAYGIIYLHWTYVQQTQLISDIRKSQTGH